MHSDKLIEAKHLSFLLSTSTIALILSLSFSEISNAESNDPAPKNSTDTEQVTSLSSLSLSELMSLEVSVATRTRQTATEAPSSVTAFTDTEIRRLGLNNLEDLLNFVPGVYANRTDLTTNGPVFRGRFTDNQAPDVLVLVDGMRMNDPVFGGAFELLSDFALENVKRVEVIRGPGSAIYGSNAMSGVINIVTQKEGNAIRASYGTQNSRTFSGRASGAIGQVSLTGFVRYQEDEGFNYDPFVVFGGLEEESTDPGSAYDASGSLRYENFVLQARYQHRRDQGFISGGSISPVVDHLRTERDNLYIQASYGLEISEDLKIDFAAGFQHVHYDNTVILALPPVASQFFWNDGSLITATGGNVRDSSEVAFNINGQWSANERNQVVFGAEFRQERSGDNPFQGNWDAELNRTSGGTILLPANGGNAIERGFYGGVGVAPSENQLLFLQSTQREVLGFYLQDELRATDKLTLTLGARFDWYEGAGSRLTFRTGAVYQATPTTTFKLLYGQAFRAPNLLEQRGEFASNFRSNPDLGAETHNTFEAAISKDFGNFRLGVTYYNGHVENAIVQVIGEPVVPGFDALQPQNIGVANFSGIEIEGAGRLSPNFDLRFGFSHTFEADSAGVAHTVANMALHYSNGPWQINLSGFYRGDAISRMADGVTFLENVVLDDAVILNSKIGYIIGDNLEVFVRGSNLLETDYRSFSDQAAAINGVPAAGRRVEAGLIYEF